MSRPISRYARRRGRVPGVARGAAASGWGPGGKGWAATPARGSARGFLLLVLANLLWSGNYVAGRVLAAAMPALLLNGIRWTVSATILLALVRLSGRRVPFRREWPRLLSLGAVGMFAFSSLTYLGLHSVGAARAGILSGVIPVTVVVFGALVAHDRPTPVTGAGAVLAVAGVVLLFGGRAAGGLGVGPGDLEILLAAVAWGLYTALGRRFAERFDPLAATAGAAVFGAVPSLVAGLLALPGQSLHMAPAAWAALAYVSTAASVLAYWAWTSGVGEVGPARAAAFVNLLPVFTALLGVALLHERLGWRTVAGGAVIIGGALLAQARGRPRTPPAAAGEVDRAEARAHPAGPAPPGSRLKMEDPHSGRRDIPDAPSGRRPGVVQGRRRHQGVDDR